MSNFKFQITNFLTGTKILEERISKYNGQLTVVRDISWGTYIKSSLSAGKASGLTQSGGVLEMIWKQALKRISNYQLTINNCLILGLGGGSIAKLLRQTYPNIKITGVDIDPIMVELGKKYLDLDKQNINIIIQDAFEFVSNYQLRINNYELICIDLYNGDKFPEKFEDERFLKLILKLLPKGGLVVFNRLYYGEKRDEAHRFYKTLESIFTEIEIIFPEANVMYVCKK